MQESSFVRLQGQIVPADESGQLTKLIRLRVPTPVLQVQLFRDARVSVDVVASRDSKRLEPEMLGPLSPTTGTYV